MQTHRGLTSKFLYSLLLFRLCQAVLVKSRCSVIIFLQNIWKAPMIKRLHIGARGHFLLCLQRDGVSGINHWISLTKTHISTHTHTYTWKCQTNSALPCINTKSNLELIRESFFWTHTCQGSTNFGLCWQTSCHISTFHHTLQPGGQRWIWLLLHLSTCLSQGIHSSSSARQGKYCIQITNHLTFQPPIPSSKFLTR